MKRTVGRLNTWGGLGDVILLTPAIHAWKEQNPTGRLIVYSGTVAHREILLGNPFIDSLRLITRLRTALCAFPSIRDKVMAAPYGFVAPSLFNKQHATAFIGEFLGLKVANTTPEIYLNAREDAGARARLKSLRVPVAMHTIARCTENKLWPAERWAELVKRSPEYDFVQIGRPNEPLVPGAHDCRGLQLRESFAIIKHSRAFVGVESAPMHAAAAFGVPAVALFGPGTPDVWGYPTAKNLYARLRCSPCIDTLLSGRCPYGRACMEAISVDAVEEALTDILGGRSAARAPIAVPAR